MHLEDTLRNVQTDRGRLLHGRLLRWQFDTVTLARRCRRGASTPSPQADPDADTKASDFIQCRLLAADCPRKKSPLDARWQEGASRGAPQRVRVARREQAVRLSPRDPQIGYLTVRLGLLPSRRESRSSMGRGKKEVNER